MTNRELSRKLDMDPADIRRAVHNLRVKGYGVLGGNDGLTKTNSLELKYKQAQKLIMMAAKTQEAAEGMIRGEHQELDEVEELILSMLPEKHVPEQTLKEFAQIEYRDGRIVEVD